MSTFRIREILDRVNALLAKNLIEECRELFVQEIFDWSDYYRENCESAEANSATAQHMQFNLTLLWQQYAQFEATLKQWKTAVEVYDKATTDPIVGRFADIYKLCSEYYITRNKPVSAKNVLITGLMNAALSKEQTDRLWCYLYSLFVTSSGPAITMEQLRDELQAKATASGSVLSDVPSEDVAKRLQEEMKATPSLSQVFQPNSAAAIAASRESQVVVTAPVSAVVPNKSVDMKIAPVMKAITTQSPLPQSPPLIVPRQPLLQQQQQQPPPSLQQAPQPQQKALPQSLPQNIDALDDLSGLTTEQLVRLFRHRPPLLLVAPSQEPMASGFKNLLPDEINQLERFLGVSLSSLLEPSFDNDSVRVRAEFVLDVLEEMWYAQAMKERHFDAWFGNLLRQQQDEVTTFEERVRTQALPVAAVQIEKSKLENRWGAKHEILEALVNKVIYSLMIEQQRVCVELDLPRFSMSLLKRIENINNIMPPNNPKGLFFDDLTTREIVSQRKVVSVLLSLRLVMKKRFNITAVAAYQQPSMAVGTAIEGNGNAEADKTDWDAFFLQQSLPPALETVPSADSALSENVDGAPVSTPSGGGGRKKRRISISAAEEVAPAVLERESSYGHEVSYGHAEMDTAPSAATEEPDQQHEVTIDAAASNESKAQDGDMELVNSAE